MVQWSTLGHTIQGNEPFSIPDEIRRQHVYVLGRTGAGKSTLLARMALADIASGAGLLVLDPHGDLVADIIDHCPDEHRDRIVYLDPSDRDHPVPMNLFECRAGQDKDTICSEVIGVFKRLYGESWGPQLEDLLRSLTLVMLDHQFLGDPRVGEDHAFNCTLKEAHDFLFDRKMRVGYYPFVANDMVRRFWLDMYDTLGSQKGSGPVSREQIRYSSSTTNKLRRLLLNPLLFDITCNSRRRNPIDLREVMDKRQVLLVNLSKGLLGEDNSSLLGSVILSRLVVAALSRADLPRADRQERLFHVIADEFQSFATESFKLLLSEARKYGITLTIAHQHRDQLDQEMKGAALNCGSLICMRLLGRDALDVGREFDATPRVANWRFVPDIMELHPDAKTEYPAEWKEAAENDADVVSITRQADECSRAIDALELKIDEIEAAWKLTIHENVPTLSELEEAEHWVNIGPRIHKPSGKLITYDPDEVLRMRAAYESARTPEEEHELFRAIEREKAKRADLMEKAEHRRLEVKKQFANFIPGRTEYQRWKDTYSKEEVMQTYAEREREIANELTQLPNFTAVLRLSTGVHRTIRTAPLPDESDHRNSRIEDLRTKTRKLAVPKAERLSISEAQYFSELRQQEAQDYEAELDEQPEPDPPA